MYVSHNLDYSIFLSFLRSHNWARFSRQLMGAYAVNWVEHGEIGEHSKCSIIPGPNSKFSNFRRKLQILEFKLTIRQIISKCVGLIPIRYLCFQKMHLLIVDYNIIELNLLYVKIISNVQEISLSEVRKMNYPWITNCNTVFDLKTMNLKSKPTLKASRACRKVVTFSRPGLTELVSKLNTLESKPVNNQLNTQEMFRNV